VAASSEPDRWQNRNPNSMGLGQDSCSAAHFRTINTILVLQTPALILINLSSLAGFAASSVLRRCGLTATLTSELCICWRNGLTELGLEQTMLGL